MNSLRNPNERWLMDLILSRVAAYDKWWGEVLPCPENENPTPPEVAHYKELYWQQMAEVRARCLVRDGCCIT